MKLTDNTMLNIVRHGRQVRVFKTKKGFEKCLQRKAPEKPVAVVHEPDMDIWKVVFKSDEWGYRKTQV